MALIKLFCNVRKLLLCLFYISLRYAFKCRLVLYCKCIIFPYHLLSAVKLMHICTYIIKLILHPFKLCFFLRCICQKIHIFKCKYNHILIDSIVCIFCNIFTYDRIYLCSFSKCFQRIIILNSGKIIFNNKAILHERNTL